MDTDTSHLLHLTARKETQINVFRRETSTEQQQIAVTPTKTDKANS